MFDPSALALLTLLLLRAATGRELPDDAERFSFPNDSLGLTRDQALQRLGTDLLGPGKKIRFDVSLDGATILAKVQSVSVEQAADLSDRSAWVQRTLSLLRRERPSGFQVVVRGAGEEITVSTAELLEWVSQVDCESVSRSFERPTAGMPASVLGVMLLEPLNESDAE